jgi:DNA-binding NtrC family response regulator
VEDAVNPAVAAIKDSIRHRRVLIVDDEENLLHMLKRALRARSWEVRTASSIEESMRALVDFSADVVLTDVRLTALQDGGGLDLMELVKERYPWTHVILMTAYGSAALEKTALMGGATYYFEKPIDLHVLIGYLDNLERTLCCESGGDRP